MEQSRLRFVIITPNTTNNQVLNNTKLYLYATNTACYKCLKLPISLSSISMMTYHEYINDNPDNPNTTQSDLVCAVIDTQYSFHYYISSEKPFSECNKTDIDIDTNKYSEEINTCVWQPSESSIIFDWKFQPHEHDWGDVLIYFDGDEITRREIRIIKRGIKDKFVPLYVLAAIVVFTVIFYNLYLVYKNSTIIGDSGGGDDSGGNVRGKHKGKKGKKGNRDRDRDNQRSKARVGSLSEGSTIISVGDDNNEELLVSNNNGSKLEKFGSKKRKSKLNITRVISSDDIAGIGVGAAVDNNGIRNYIESDQTDQRNSSNPNYNISSIDNMKKITTTENTSKHNTNNIKNKNKNKNHNKSKNKNRNKNNKNNGKQISHPQQPLLSPMNQEYTKYNNNTKKHNRRKQSHMRLVPLDSLRGLTVILMIFVNDGDTNNNNNNSSRTGGGGYIMFLPSIWENIPTVYDSILPFFLFCMGMAMSLTFPRYLHKIFEKKSKSLIYFLYKIVKRVLILFILNLFLSSQEWFEYIRIPGVLLFLSISYLFNSILLLLTEPSTSYIMDNNKPSIIKNLYIPEIILFWKQLIMVLIFILLPFVCLQKYLPYSLWHNSNSNSNSSRCPIGYIGSGGIGDNGKYTGCTGGAHLYIDTVFYGYSHLDKDSRVEEMYYSGHFDRLGILSNFMGIFITFIGILMGRVLYVHYDHKERILRWIVYSIVFGCICMVLCGLSIHDGIIPLNASIWSISFVMFELSMVLIVFCIFYIMIDIVKIWDGKPFGFIGRNSLFIYVMSIVLKDFFPFSWKTDEASNANLPNGIEYHTHEQLIASSSIAVIVWIAIAWYLNSKRVYYTL